MNRGAPPGLRWRVYLLTGVLTAGMCAVVITVLDVTRNSGLSLLAVAIVTLASLVVSKAAQRRWRERLDPERK